MSRTMSTAAAANPGAAWLHPGVRVIDGAGAPVAPPPTGSSACRAARPRPGLGGDPRRLAAARQLDVPAVRHVPHRGRALGTASGPGTTSCWTSTCTCGCWWPASGDARSTSSASSTGGTRRACPRPSGSPARGSTRSAHYFAETARRMERAGWPRAARASRRHVTSRLHAARCSPGSLLRGRWGAAAAWPGTSSRGPGAGPIHRLGAALPDLLHERHSGRGRPDVPGDRGDGSGPPVELSVVLPCLNEAETLADLRRQGARAPSRARRRRRGHRRRQRQTDGSQRARARAGARVVDVPMPRIRRGAAGRHRGRARALRAHGRRRRQLRPRGPRAVRRSSCAKETTS